MKQYTKKECEDLLETAFKNLEEFKNETLNSLKATLDNLPDKYKKENGYKDVKFKQWSTEPTNPVVGAPSFKLTFTTQTDEEYPDLFTLNVVDSDKIIDSEKDREYISDIIFGRLIYDYNLGIKGIFTATQYERSKNIAYKYLIDRLNNGTTDSNDTNIKPNPPNPDNPDQDTGSSLPGFCDYAVVICDFINWFKKDPDSASDENVSIKDHGTESYNHYWTEYFNVSPMCPRPHIIDFTIDL